MVAMASPTELATNVKDARSRLVSHLQVLATGREGDATKKTPKKGAAESPGGHAAVQDAIKDLLERTTRCSLSAACVEKAQTALKERIPVWRQRHADDFCTFFVLLDNYIWLHVAVKEGDATVSSPGAASRKTRQIRYLVDFSQWAYSQLTDSIRGKRSEGQEKILNSFKNTFMPFWVDLLDRTQPQPLQPYRKAHMIARIRDTVITSNRVRRSLPSLLDPHRLGSYLGQSTELAASIDLLEIAHYWSRELQADQKATFYETIFTSALRDELPQERVQLSPQAHATSAVPSVPGNVESLLLARELSQKASALTAVTFDTICEKIIGRIGELQLSRPQMFECPTAATMERAPEWLVPREQPPGSKRFHLWFSSTKLSIDVKDTYEVQRLLKSYADKAPGWHEKLQNVDSTDCVIAFEDIEDISVDSLTGECDVATKQPIVVQQGSQGQVDTTMGNIISFQLSGDATSRLAGVLGQRGLAFRWRGGRSETPIALRPLEKVSAQHLDDSGYFSGSDLAAIGPTAPSFEAEGERQPHQDQRNGQRSDQLGAEQPGTRRDGEEATPTRDEATGDTASELMEQYIEFDDAASVAAGGNQKGSAVKERSPRQQTALAARPSGGAFPSVEKLGKHTLGPLPPQQMPSTPSSSLTTMGSEGSTTSLRRSSRLLERQSSPRASSPATSPTKPSRQKARSRLSPERRPAKRNHSDIEESAADFSASEPEATPSPSPPAKKRAKDRGATKFKGTSVVVSKAKKAAPKPKPAPATSTSRRKQTQAQAKAGASDKQSPESGAGGESSTSSEAAAKRSRSKKKAGSVGTTVPRKDHVASSAHPAVRSPSGTGSETDHAVSGAEHGQQRPSTRPQMGERSRKASEAGLHDGAEDDDMLDEADLALHDEAPSEPTAAKAAQEGFVEAHKKDREARGIRRSSDAVSGPKSDEAPWMTERHRRSIALLTSEAEPPRTTSPLQSEVGPEALRAEARAGGEAEEGEGRHSPTPFAAAAEAQFSDDLEYVEDIAVAPPPAVVDEERRPSSPSNEEAERGVEEPRIVEPPVLPRSVPVSPTRGLDDVAAAQSGPVALPTGAAREVEQPESNGQAKQSTPPAAPEAQSPRREVAQPSLPEAEATEMDQTRALPPWTSEAEMPIESQPQDSLSAAQLAALGRTVTKPMRSPPFGPPPAPRPVPPEPREVDSELIEFYEFRAFQQRKKRALDSLAAGRVTPERDGHFPDPASMSGPASRDRQTTSPTERLRRFEEHSSLVAHAQGDFEAYEAAHRETPGPAASPRRQGRSRTRLGTTRPTRPSTADRWKARSGTRTQAASSLGKRSSPEDDEAHEREVRTSPSPLAHAGDNRETSPGTASPDPALDALHQVKEALGSVTEVLCTNLREKISWSEDGAVRLLHQMFHEASRLLEETHTGSNAAKEMVQAILDSQAEAKRAIARVLDTSAASAGDARSPPTMQRVPHLLGALEGGATERSDMARKVVLPDKLFA
ncbi:uncharacterized protein PFL1_05013 [Pseudozyma flocculosa PF-1]|uniref:Uncharacterized protein n=1 Tax=Pseudozyma flocculosa PF-1 TaxID=1277687 RepID=A0A061H647_9BASI|nr:uncharacterized protein PFL1_05013 [Pseudozyma flocculosa PF-1]EPQ27475.1 hypothetical protein PFL1_05013 [Pseudozyma flocculosa PF-1]